MSVLADNPLVPIDGGCHCGNIHFTLRWPASQTEIAMRKCSCRFCQLHQGAWTSNRSSELAIRIHDEALISKYRFGTKTADFYVCSVCGVVPFVACEIKDVTYAVVSVNAFDDVNDFSLSSSTTDFDGEDVGSRLERRQRNWIPTVKFDAPDN